MRRLTFIPRAAVILLLPIQDLERGDRGVLQLEIGGRKFELPVNALIGKTESFGYDSLNRLTSAQVSGYSAVTVGYSATGRIDSKSDVGSYTYGDSGHPQAVTSAGGVSYGYDASGRMTSRGGSPITWYSYDLPKRIDSGSQSAEFAYGVDRARYKQIQRTGSTVDATIYYVGSLFEKEIGGATTYRHYVSARGRTVAVVKRVGTTNTTQYLHRDHQASVVKITNASGSVDESLAFDAWGLRRDATNWAALGSPFGGTQQLERGYTGHEHLDRVGLIHMNGRVQDPKLGRFISADPLVQSPFHTQSQNRYSYVWNNPLTLVDPSGFQGKGKPSEQPNDWCKDCTAEQAEYLRCLLAQDCIEEIVVYGSESGEGRSLPTPGVRSYSYDRGYDFMGGESTGRDSPGGSTGNGPLARPGPMSTEQASVGLLDAGAAAVVVLSVAIPYDGPLLDMAAIAAMGARAAKVGALVGATTLLKSDTDRQNRMRLQAQKGFDNIAPGIPLFGKAQTGVTKAQVYSGLGVLYTAVNAVEPGLGQSAEFSAAIVALSADVKAIQGGVEEVGNVLRAEFVYHGELYRVDLDNMNGHNLRE